MKICIYIKHNGFGEREREREVYTFFEYENIFYNRSIKILYSIKI